MATAHAAHSARRGDLRIHPRRDGLLVAAGLLGTACLSVALLYHRAHGAHRAEVHAGLVRAAQAAAATVDGDQHERLVDPAQESEPAYQEAVAALRRIRSAVDDVRYIYTVRLVGGRVYFVLDAALPGDADGDGVEDHSGIMEPYPDADPAMLAALREGRATTTDRPYADQWGTFLSGYAPLRNSAGRQVGVVGVDMTLAKYDQRLAAIRRTALWGLLPALLVSLAAGTAVYRLRRSALRAARELQHATVAAQSASRAKSDFLANMSHEIRTPLTAILGFAQTLSDEGLTESERRDAVETIQRNGEHLLRIIDEILDLSRIEAGRLPIEHLPCDVAELVRDVAAVIRPWAAAKGLTLRVELAAVPPGVHTDPTRLRQILSNLLGNAIKFTAAGGVTLAVVLDPGTPARARAGAPRLRIRVTDTGIGMDPGQLGRIFDPFMQADETVTRRFGGTGLGLAICKRLVNMLGGEIRVASTPGAGTTFDLWLPVCVPPARAPAPAAAAAPAAPPATGPPAPVGRGRRVLLAEDGPDNQRLLSYMLRRAGVDVQLVADGNAAVEAALAARDAGRPFDVVLMDMQMPVVDGYMATRMLRRRGYRGRIVALTAHAMVGDRERCLAAGCDDYLAKPIDRQALLRALRPAAEVLSPGG